MLKTVKPEWIIADITALCPEAPLALVQRAIMRSARKFAKTCMHAIWVQVPTQENVQHYPFERFLPKGFGVEAVTDVKYNGCCIPCIDDECGTCPIGYSLDDLTQITLHGYCPQGKTGECETLEVKVVLRIAPESKELPKDLVDRFEEPLYNGALGILLAMKGQPWEDFRAAEFYENQFKGDIASAKCVVANKFGSGSDTIPGERMV